MAKGKWIRGNLNKPKRIQTLSPTTPPTILFPNIATHGTKLVWNSFKSTLSDPSNRNEAVMDETT